MSVPLSGEPARDEGELERDEAPEDMLYECCRRWLLGLPGGVI